GSEVGWDVGLTGVVAAPAAELTRRGHGAGVSGLAGDGGDKAELVRHLRVALSLLAPTIELAVCGDGTGVSAARADLSEGAARGRLWRLGTVAPAANGTSGINRTA